MRKWALVRAAPVALLLLPPLLLLGRTLTGERALISVHTDQLSPWREAVPAAEVEALAAASDPVSADKTLMFHPLLVACLARLHAGEVPLWNPDSLCGVPLLAQAVHGIFSPPMLLATSLVPPALAYGWVALLQTVLAALFMALLARQLSCGPWPSVLAGLSFALSGFFATRMQYLQITGAALWLPAVLLGVERIVAGGGRRAVCGTALALGCSSLAGFPQSTVHIVYAAGLWAAVRLAGAARRRRSGPPRTGGPAGVVPAALRLAAALGLGLCIGWPQFGTSAEMALSPESTRRAVPPAVVAGLAMSPSNLAAALVPDLFGNPRDLRRHTLPHLREDGVMRRLFCKPGSNAIETASTFGTLPLLLALLGLTLRRPGAALGAGLLLLGALLSIDTPLLAPLLHLPALDTADPRRFLLWFEAGGALLAALGLAAVLERGPPRWFTASVCALATFFVAATAVLLALDGAQWTAAVTPGLAAGTGLPEREIAAHAQDLLLDLQLLQSALLRTTLWLLVGAGALVIAGRRPRLGAAVLVAGAACELLLFADRATTTLPAAHWFAEPPGLPALLDDDGGRLVRFHAGDPRRVLEYPLPPGTGLPFGVRDSSRYVALSPRRVEALADLVQPGSGCGLGTAAITDPQALDSPLLDVMAVTRVLSDVPLDRPGLPPLGRVGDGWLYRNDGALPRAFLAPALLEVADEAGAREALVQPGVDPRRRVVVEGRLAGDRKAEEVAPAGDGTPPTPDGSGGQAASGEQGSVRFLRDEPEHVQLAVDSPGPGVLVLCDTWFPGWTAEVDGSPAAVRPANLAFRAVAVPGGEHRVTFRYRSAAFDVGAPLGAAGMLLALAGLLWPRRRPAGSPSATGGAASAPSSDRSSATSARSRERRDQTQ